MQITKFISTINFKVYDAAINVYFSYVFYSLNPAFLTIPPVYLKINTHRKMYQN